MYVLGIETSCDETAVAVVDENKQILSNLVLSQLEEHKEFGGVVPEIAARAHLDHIDQLIAAAMSDASITFNDLSGVAATCGPGLIGGVMVGMMAGKAIAASKKLPFLAINHLEAHALTARLTDELTFPYLLLLVSGGHTQILVVKDVGEYERLGTTLDDAAGECFDKSAKLMGLSYPGGPSVEKKALECKNTEIALEKFNLPRPLYKKKGCDFSFSGLKTAVRYAITELNSSNNLTDQNITDLCYALQKTVADILCDRLTNAIDIFNNNYKHNNIKPTLVVSGGVGANKFIRKNLNLLTTKYNMSFIAPPIELCSDNGAMVAWAGVERLKRDMTNSYDFAAKPRWPLDPNAEPRPGAGVKA
jgi:N6-L-threonylcarbamoyladenine synthase